MSLSIQDCASQLDLYASLFDKDAAASEARYKEHESKDNPESVAICRWETHRIGVAQANAHQLRFAATFLRENAVLKWTVEPPTKAALGYWWERIGYTGTAHIVSIVRASDGYLYSIDGHDSRPLRHMQGYQWAGPVESPIEP